MSTDDMFDSQQSQQLVNEEGNGFGGRNAFSQPCGVVEGSTKWKVPKVRSRNWSIREEFALVDGMEELEQLISKKLDNQTTNIKKNRAWEDITKKVNAVSTVHRTKALVKVKWEQMKSGAKKRNKDIVNHMRGTGGGAAKNFP